MIGVVAERNAVWRPKGSGAQPKDRRGSRRECGVEAERKAVRRRVDRSGSKKPQEWDEVAPSGTVVRKQPAEAKREP